MKQLPGLLQGLLMYLLLYETAPLVRERELAGFDLSLFTVFLPFGTEIVLQFN